MDEVGKLLRDFKYKELESSCLPLLHEIKQMWEQELFVEVEIGSKYFN